MGLRDRLKQGVKRALGREPAPPQPPPAARPPRPSPAPPATTAPPARAEAPPPPAPLPAPPAPPAPLPAPPLPALAPPEAVSSPPDPAPSADGPRPPPSDAPARQARLRPAPTASDRAHLVELYDHRLERWLSFPCEPGEFVLDAAERAGHELPYSCRNGGCLVCAGRLLDGEAAMADQYVLEEDQIARGFRLLCCTTISGPARFLGDQEKAI